MTNSKIILDNGFPSGARKTFKVLPSRRRGRFLLFILISVLVLPSFLLAEESDSFDFKICESFEEIDKQCEDLSPEECKELLKKCGEYLEEKSAEIEKDLEKTEKEKKSLQNEIYTLNNKIKSLDYQVYQGNVMIKDLSLQIRDTQSSIDKISFKIEDSRDQLVNVLRTVYEEDQKSSIEILLEGSLSDFFDNLVYLENLDSKLQETLENTKNLKSYLGEQKEEMGEEKEDLENLTKIQTLQKQEKAATKKEQEYYLGLTEQQYQKQLEEKQETEKTAAEIRTRIFELIGVPKAPTFGEAYELAKEVEKLTSVRPAFLLAVLTQESNIGKNVGQCYLRNTKTGEGIYIRTGNKTYKTMSPSNIPYFLEIIEKLNKAKDLARDPFETPISCPMSYGWGGAMGPAQFMPKTWGEYGYGERVEGITGKVSDPWDIKDAFLASALYLSDYGAVRQTYNGEFNAALSYFAGPSWYKSRYKGVYERDYGYPVMRIVENYERDIKKLEK